MGGHARLVYRFTDGLLDAIHGRLASVAPERGGALLAAGELVHLLLEDTHGCYSSASWDISPELTEAVGAVETAGHGVLVGTCHTHPPGVPDPSPTDVQTTRHALDLNPHLAELLIAVVSEGAPREHDVAIGPAHRMSVHVLRRDPGGAGRPLPVRVRVVPIAGDLRHCGTDVAWATTSGGWVPTRDGDGDVPAAADRGGVLPLCVAVEGADRLWIPVGGEAGGGAALLFAAAYPAAGPLVLRGRDGHLVTVASPWDPTAAARPQLAALATAAAGRRIGDMTARVDPLVGSLAGRHVLVAGAGSVGSRLAEDLVRAGVGRLTVIDPDVVAAVNLARTVYVAADVGDPKCAALARRLRAINPAVTVHGWERPLGEVGLAPIISGEGGVPPVDLVVGATDDMAEQATLAHAAYHLGTPMVACALYRAAAAGEVVVVSPRARSACWLCATGQHADAASVRQETDYGLGGRLAGEIALGPPIQLVAAVAAMAAIGLLAGPDRPAGDPLVRLLQERRTLGLVSTAPQWQWFPTVFAGMSHQHAPQSVWLVVPANPACTVCGEHPVPPVSREFGTDLAELVTALTAPACTLPDDTAH